MTKKHIFIIENNLQKVFFNLILYLFQEDYIQPEATSSSPQMVLQSVFHLSRRTTVIQDLLVFTGTGQ